MITISTRDYTTEQLHDLARGLSYTLNEIHNSPECEEQEECTPNCKAYAICGDTYRARRYIWSKIKEREALEIHRDTQESE